VSVQTVSHAYGYAEKKGALESWVGNGTFVKSGFVDESTDTEFMLTQEMKETPDEIDMSIAHPVVTDRHITLLFSVDCSLLIVHCYFGCQLGICSS